MNGARSIAHRAGWMLVLAVAIVEAGASAMLLAQGVGAQFEADTGMGWEGFRDDYPTVAGQFALAARSAALGSAAVGALCVLVCVFGLRASQRWAWFALWIMPLSMLPGALGLASTDGQEAYGWFGMGLVAVAVVGLLLTVPRTRGVGGAPIGG